MKINIEFRGITIPLTFSSIGKKEVLNYKNIKGVYLLLNKRKDIIYVGISNNVGLRVYNHTKGTTHTKHFSKEIESIYYLTEEDVFEREALEKVLIAYIKPTYNLTSETNGVRRYKEIDVVNVKYLLSKGTYTSREIAKVLDVNEAFVGDVRLGRKGIDIEIPEGFSLDVPEGGKKLRDAKALEECYRHYVGGETVAKSAELESVNLSTFKALLFSKQKGYKELREVFEEKYGVPVKRKLKKITDEEVYKVFQLRFIEEYKMKDIPKEANISQASASQIIYRLKPRYEKIYQQFLKDTGLPL